jgi:putative FmdB family regulatory protein
MPTYEYLCQSCGARFEAWQKMSDDPIDICPTCGDHVRRIIFPVGLVFKGSGFYINDTRSAATPAKSTEDAASSATATAEAGKPEAGKPEAGKPEASQSTSPADSSSSSSGASSGGSDKPSTSTAAGASPTASGT